MKKLNFDKKILITSVILTFIMATISIVVGLLIDSSFVLFAGLNTSVMLISSMAMLLTDGYIRKKDPVKFPFGKHSIAPFLVFIQYTLVTVMLVISLIEGINVIIAGGNNIDLIFLLIYNSITVVVYNAIYFFLRQQAKKTDSIIVNAEVKTWRIDAYVTVAVLIGLGLTFLLIHLGVEWIGSYIDGIVLIGMSLFLMIDPIKEIFHNVAELLNMNNLDEEVVTQVKKCIKQIQKEYKINKNYTRLTKNGELLFIEVDFIVPLDWEFDAIEYQDEIRAKIDKMTESLNIKRWMAISFTSDEKWAIES